MSEKIRLLACGECKTIEELPDFEGHPSQDHLLNALVSKHESNGRRHQPALLADVEKVKWDDANVRTEVAKQLAQRLSGKGETGLGTPFYTTRDTFRDDAMACWKKHLRNPACNDYKNDDKRLTPGTSAERKAAGLPEYSHANDRYLCEFCPVHSLVVTAARKAAGAYDA
jgi:hypothetical protein